MILNFVWHSFSQDIIGKGLYDSYLGLGIIHSQPFLNKFFVNIILILFSMLSLFFRYFIAKGLAMCRLGGGVISAQKVLF